MAISFMSIVGHISSFASITGITCKDIKAGIFREDKNKIEQYIIYLSSKRALTEPFENEVTFAVISSLEDIKKETERLRSECSESSVRDVLVGLIFYLSKELNTLHKNSGKDEEVNFYLCLQRIRRKFARALAMFCHCYSLDLSGKYHEMASFIMDHGYNPR